MESNKIICLFIRIQVLRESYNIYLRIWKVGTISNNVNRRDCFREERDN